MIVHDYRRCHARFTLVGEDGSVWRVRTPITARFELIHVELNRSRSFFLGTTSLGMYLFPEEGGIVHLPTCEETPIFTERWAKLIRKYASGEDDIDPSIRYGQAAPLFGDIRARWESSEWELASQVGEPLESGKAVIEAAGRGAPLVGRTTWVSASGLWQAILEYPVAQIAVEPARERFQVCTGPVLYLDLSRLSTPVISCVQLAYIAFQDFARAELALQVSTAVGYVNSGITTQHPSQVLPLEGRNELFSLETREEWERHGYR